MATSSQEDADEQTSDDEGLPVAELQLTERKVEAEVVMFEKTLAFLT